jgi:ABC-2 type transport system permease protein
MFRLPLLVVAFFLPEPYRLALPNPLGAVLFLPSILLALGVTASLTMLMYVSMFYTISYRGVRVLLIATTSFFTGAVIPLPFFPASVRSVLEALPFAAMQNIPLRIFSGNIFGADILKGLVFQVCWLTVLIVSGRLALSRSLQKVTVQGG